METKSIVNSFERCHC